MILLSAFAKAETVYQIPKLLNKTDRGEYLPKAHYQILGFSIEGLSLNDIKNIIGSAPTYKGEHTANHICYKNKAEVIEFSVSGFGPGYKVRKNKKDKSNCSNLNRDFKNGYGLRLGLTRSEVLSLLGKPSRIDETSISYSYWIQEKPSKEVEDRLKTAHNLPDNYILWADISSFIYIKMENGFVSQYSISTTETY